MIINLKPREYLQKVFRSDCISLYIKNMLDAILGFKVKFKKNIIKI